MDIRAYLKRNAQIVEEYLAEYMAGRRDGFESLFEAVEYSLFSGGKRIRPVLTIAAAESVGGKAETVLPFACAIEMIHTYSLIHDDLPAMDDDDLRRGKPTCHRAFGEAVAILAGDALLTEAFVLMSDVGRWNGIYHHEALEVIGHIARAAGITGMGGGQSMDIALQEGDADLPTLETLHRAKTGRLILASIFAGARLSGATDGEMERLLGYGERIGLAFQIRDDLLNVLGDARKMGKAAGSDKDHRKATFPAVLGVEASEARLDALVGEAADLLEPIGPRADPLCALARFVSERES